MDIHEVGLILEGGGMRGVYTAGVLDVLLEENLLFADIYGVSAGACHACSYRSRQKGRAARTVIDYVHDKRYCGWRTLLRTGDFFGVDMVYHEIPDKLIPFDYDTYRKAGGALYAAATNCRTGEAEYLRVDDCETQMDYVRASSSLPMLSKPVTIGQEDYLDGGVSDSIPLAKSMADGHDKNLVVLTQHRGYQKRPNTLAGVAKMQYRRYPALAQAIRTRHLRYNEALELVERQQEQGKAFVIQPKQPVEIGRLEKDKDKLRELYRQGYADAEEALPKLRRFLEATGTKGQGENPLQAMEN